MNWFNLLSPYRAVNTACHSLQNPSVNSVYVSLRSVEIKDTSLAKCEVLWAKIKRPFAEISWRFICHSSCLFVTSIVILVAIGQYFIARYWMGVYLRCCLDVRIRDFPETSHLPLHTHIGHKWCNFICELSITKPIYLKNRVQFPLYLHFCINVIPTVSTCTRHSCT